MQRTYKYRQEKSLFYIQQKTNRNMRAFITLFLIINANLIASSSVSDQCDNYCTSGGACLITNTGPKCVCHLEWTGERCETRLFENEVGKANSESNLCNFIPADYCKNGGKCYVDTLKNMFACFCTYPYTGQYCEQISGTNRRKHFLYVNQNIYFEDCAGFCDNNGICEVKDGQLKCTCMKGWEGLRCRTLAPLTPDPNLHPVCELLGITYCNTGRCTVENGSVKCICPSNYTGNRCETRTTITDPGK